MPYLSHRTQWNNKKLKNLVFWNFLKFSKKMAYGHFWLKWILLSQYASKNKNYGPIRISVKILYKVRPKKNYVKNLQHFYVFSNSLKLIFFH